MNDLLYGGFSPFGGLQVIEDIRMTVAGEPYEVVRTWKERLFTKPWRPLKKTRTVVPQVPSREVIRFQNKMVCHPEVAKELRRQIQAAI
jgi:hypothetical protein